MNTVTHSNGTSKVSLQNHLGLRNSDMEQLAESMNGLLSDYFVCYQNVRGFHWNVKGSDFFELHARFEELYKLLGEAQDDLAERIVTMGCQPLHAASDYLQRSAQKEVRGVKDGKQCVKYLLEGLGKLIGSIRTVCNEASDINDLATADLLTRQLVSLEKKLWMFTMYGS